MVNLRKDSRDQQLAQELIAVKREIREENEHANWLLYVLLGGGRRLVKPDHQYQY